MTTKQQAKQAARHQCDNCGAIVTDAKLKVEIPHLAERLDPGGVVPSGECRKCGALVYPMPEPKAAPPEPGVKIYATDNAVTVTILRDGKKETLRYETPGMLTGSDLRDVLGACGIDADYSYKE